MKYNIIYLSFTLLLFLTSCSSEEDEILSPETFGTWSPSFVDQTTSFTQTRTGNQGSSESRTINVTSSSSSEETDEYVEGEDLNGDGDQVDDVTITTTIYTASENLGSYTSLTTEITENNVSHYTKVAATDNNMTVVIEDAAWDVLPTEGAEIAAFDKNGNMVGSAIYSSPVTVVTVWGDDATTTSKDGMLVSESVSFKVWNTNEVRDFTVAKWIEGSSSYQVDGISVASTIETNNMITELNTSERVLVKVINVLGQEVNMDDQPFKGTVLFNVYDDGSVKRFVE